MTSQTEEPKNEVQKFSGQHLLANFGFKYGVTGKTALHFRKTASLNVGFIVKNEHIGSLPASTNYSSTQKLNERT